MGSIHQECGERPDISRNLIYRYNDVHDSTDWQIDCKCDNIANISYTWLDREKANKLVICEKNVNDEPLIKNIVIDNVELTLASAIVREGNHFKCIIPDYEKNILYGIEDKVTNIKETEKNFSKSMTFYETTKHIPRNNSIPIKLTPYSRNDLKKLDTIKFEEIKEQKKASASEWYDTNKDQKKASMTEWNYLL